MKELEFEDKGEFLEALVQVDDDFNIHIERSISAIVVVEATTVENGKYAPQFTETAQVIDKDVHGLVYPKWLRIRSYSKYAKGYITEA